jgi:hypothetical protein
VAFGLQRVRLSGRLRLQDRHKQLTLILAAAQMWLFVP